MLEPATRQSPSWYVRHAGGALALVFGLAALLAGFWTQFRGDRAITDPSDLRVVLPFGAAAIVAGVVSLVRRERPAGLAIGALAMAIASPLLGWVVLVAAVAAAAVAVALIVAKFQ